MNWLLLGLLDGQPALAAETARAPVTPHARTEMLAINGVEASATEVPQYERLELTVALTATYDNPFDPDEVALDARVKTPAGREFRIPGFYHQSYRRDLKGGREVLTAEGPATWRVRLAFTETGNHSIILVARDASGTVQAEPLRVRTTPSAHPGFVRVSPRDRRYFEFDNGQAMFPIGANVCWAGSRGTFDYDDWLAGYAGVGANYLRLWLSPHWTTFALEQAGPAAEGKGLGWFDLANAWRIDYVLDLAARQEMWVKLCIESFNVLRERDGFPQWDNSPHNAKHGGPLQRPAEFWTNAVMDRLYQQKLRYLVARYGASPQVFAWEFWNEADLTTDYTSGLSRAWHQRMARALRALDPYAHLITTSFAHTPGDPEVDRLREMDYAQTHHYGSPDLCLTLARSQATKAAYGKPHYVGEIGADAGGPRRRDDPEGLQVHDPLWVSVVTGGAGAAQSWWWDNLIHPQRLYPLFAPLVQFTAEVDWPAEQFRSVTPTVEFQVKPDPVQRRDLLLETGPVSWERTRFNEPCTVHVTQEGVSGDLPLAGIQHGLGGHRDKHNPVTFEFDLPWESRFEVLVGDVSGHGGATLKILRDGETVLTQDFPDTDDSRATLTHFAGTHGIDVPAGRHTVVVENTGRDWFMVQYRLRNALESSRPPVLAWALAGRTAVLAWARLEGRTWQGVCARKETIPPAPPSVLVLPTVGAGDWTVEVWDTWGKGVIRTQTLTLTAAGEVRIAVPEMERDYAVKLRRR